MKVLLIKMHKQWAPLSWVPRFIKELEVFKVLGRKTPEGPFQENIFLSHDAAQGFIKRTYGVGAEVVLYDATCMRDEQYVKEKMVKPGLKPRDKGN